MLDCVAVKKEIEAYRMQRVHVDEAGPLTIEEAINILGKTVDKVHTTDQNLTIYFTDKTILEVWAIYSFNEIILDGYVGLLEAE